MERSCLVWSWMSCIVWYGCKKKFEWSSIGKCEMRVWYGQLVVANDKAKK